jgi:NADH-quinone oxidoreductase subunit N
VTGLAPAHLAPELLATAAALVLLLLAVSRRRPQLVMLPVGLGAIALGTRMVLDGATVPGVVVGLLGVAAPLLPALLPGRATLQQAWGAGLALGGALVLTGWQIAVALGEGGALGLTGWRGSVAVDGLAAVTRLTVYLSALLVIPMGYGYLQERRINRAEVEPLILLAAVGMALLGAANDLITIVIALEVLSFALYVLAGLARRDRRSQESSLKYFVSGAVASAVLLYGMALTYLATGALDLPAIGAALGSVLVPSGVVAVALVLVAVGVGFKVALAPFHLWAPDVYQGAPTSVTALMAAATKAAAFALLLRMALVAFPALSAAWAPTLAVLAAASMLYGAVAALVQADLKRILAYSSVTHAGYAAIGVVARSTEGLGATMTYLLTYAVGSLAAFGAVIAVERRRRGEVTLATLRGLGRTSPLLAGILALALLSLAGIPLTAGFIGKLEVFRAGVAAGWTWLVVVGVLSSVIAAGFYLRIAGVMFLEEAPDGDAATDEDRLPVLSTGLSAATALSAALVVVVGVQPALLLELAGQASVLVR